MELAPLRMTNKLRTGIEVIDRQHEEYFSRANKLLRYKTIAWETDKDVIKETLNFIWVYVVEHFGTEEELMSNFDYPDCDEHKEKHQKFRDQFLKFKENVENVPPEVDLSKTLTYLMRDWFLKQIIVDDKKMADFFKVRAKSDSVLVRYLKDMMDKFFPDEE